MNNLIQDLRYSIRQIQKNPGFAFTTVLTLALAIGVTTVVFSVLYATLIQPLPYNHPDRIVFLQGISPQGYDQPASYPEYLDWKRENKSFTTLAGYSTGSSNFEGPAGPQPIHTVGTTDGFFNVFQVAPLLGRTFAAGEDEPGKNNVAVLSYEVWQQTFAKAESVIGQTIKLDGQIFTVIGVMPAGFRYPVNQHNTIYTPLQITKEQREARGNHWMPTIARLKDGFSLQTAEADMNRVLTDQARAFPDRQGRRMRSMSLTAFVVGDTAAPLKVLIFAVLSLLAIGCVNIAGLLLARGVKREREFALRSAIGANRVRVIRQILTETVVLALLGAIAGIALAYGLLQVIRTLLISALSRGADVHLSLPVLLAALTVAVLTSLIAGLTPALRLSGIAPALTLKSGGNTGSGKGQHRLRAAFIVTQVGLAMVLLVVSGLLMRALAGLRSTSLGFNPDHLITEEIDLSPAAYEGRDYVTSFYQPMLEKVRAIPGVVDAGLIQILPIQSYGWNSEIQVIGQPPPPKNAETLAEDRYVTPGYFKAMGIELVRGRIVDPKLDTTTSQQVAVVNEAFAKKFLPDGVDPVGQYIGYPDDPAKIQIIGLVRSIRQNIYQPPLAEMDFPITQMAAKDQKLWISRMQLVVRTSVDPNSIAPSLRRAFHEVDPGLPFRKPQTMFEVVSDVLIFERLENWLFGSFAALAVLLALVGLYGLISHEVELSTRDLGVKMALGATRMQVLISVYRRVGTMLLGGILAGSIATFAVQKILQAVVEIHAGKDLAIVIGLAVALVVAGLLAALLPAKRAASIEPMKALRYE